MTAQSLKSRPPSKYALAALLVSTLFAIAHPTPVAATPEQGHSIIATAPDHATATIRKPIGIVPSYQDSIRSGRSLPLERLQQHATTRANMNSSGIIQEDFAPPIENWNAGHRGIDFSANNGDIVISASDGKVGFLGKVGGKPVVTVITNQNIRITYEPVESALTVGTAVASGGTLGQVAASQRSHCADRCLHVGAKFGSKYLDPWPFMAHWIHVSLLPPNR